MAPERPMTDVEQQYVEHSSNKIAQTDVYTVQTVLYTSSGVIPTIFQNAAVAFVQSIELSRPLYRTTTRQKPAVGKWKVVELLQTVQPMLRASEVTRCILR